MEMTSNWKTPDLEDSTRPELTQCCACYDIYRYLALIIYLNKCSTKNLYLSIICLLLEEISSDTSIKDSQWPFTFYMKLFYKIATPPPSHIHTYCHNHNSTQPNITKVGFDAKMTLHHHHHQQQQHPPPPGTQQHQYLSCCWSDFNQTLKVGFWDQQQQHEQ